MMQSRIYAYIYIYYYIYISFTQNNRGSDEVRIRIMKEWQKMGEHETIHTRET